MGCVRKHQNASMILCSIEKWQRLGHQNSSCQWTLSYSKKKQVLSRRGSQGRMLYTVSTETTNNPIAGGNFTIGRKKGGWQSSGENEARKIQGVTRHFRNSSWPAFRVRENKHAEIRYINPKTKYENVFIPPILVQANNTNAGFLFALLKLFQWHTWFTSSFGRLVI